MLKSAHYYGEFEYIVPEVVRGKSWLEQRAVCFDAEAGYNYLLGCSYLDGMGLKQHFSYILIENKLGKPLGLFIDSDSQVAGAYVKTDQGIFLIKNPLEIEDSLAGRTNALRSNKPGFFDIYFHKNSAKWSLARGAYQHGVGRIDDSQAELNIMSLPGLQMIAEVSDSDEDLFTVLLNRMRDNGIDTTGISRPRDLISDQLDLAGLPPDVVEIYTEVLMRIEA